MTETGGVLASSVTLYDERNRLVTFPVGSTPPVWAQVLITNPKAWVSALQSAPTPEDASENTGSSDTTPPADEAQEDLVGELPEPPKRGSGSGRAAWTAFADSKGVEYPDDASRDDIIEALESAGVID